MKKITLYFFIFSLGFLGHFLVVRFKVKPLDPDTYLKLGSETVLEGNADSFITYVEFNGESFSPNRVKIKRGDYLAITNTSSEKLMWLISANADLKTVRGYGLGERLQVNLSEPGTYVVADKQNLNKPLNVVVE